MSPLIHILCLAYFVILCILLQRKVPKYSPLRV